MELNLAGKNALVCGASQGIGFAIASSLACEGANIYICGRNKDRLDAAAGELQKIATGRVVSEAIDLGQIPNMVTWGEKVWDTFGHLDILIWNSGGPTPSAALNTSEKAWRDGFQSLFLNGSQLISLVASKMQARQSGRILLITSSSVVEPIDHLAVSTAMRSALTGYAKTLSREVAESGVTVNCLMPGIIHTKRIENLRLAKAEREGTTLAQEMQTTREQIPMKRMGEANELADLAVFLVSERAAYVTGQNIAVDGGLKRSV